jgi:hypothetical protein
MLALIDGKSTAKFKLSVIKKTKKEKEKQTENDNETYLPGRDDSEVLSTGYTVADYRNDRVIGESIYAVIDKINALDETSVTFNIDLRTLYNEGQGYVDTIYSQKYTAEMQANLDAAYQARKQ